VSPLEQPHEKRWAKNFLATSKSTSLEAKPVIIVTYLLPFLWFLVITILDGTFSFFDFGIAFPPLFWCEDFFSAVAFSASLEAAALAWPLAFSELAVEVFLPPESLTR
jgi:hypothetical protein